MLDLPHRDHICIFLLTTNGYVFHQLFLSIKYVYCFCFFYDSCLYLLLIFLGIYNCVLSNNMLQWQIYIYHWYDTSGFQFGEFFVCFFTFVALLFFQLFCGQVLVYDLFICICQHICHVCIYFCTEFQLLCDLLCTIYVDFLLHLLIKVVL